MKFLTNLGQLWQGPVNGKGVAEQYLYCNSAPHQLTGIYPIGTTCATKGSATAVYSAGYDAWGNETSRTYNSVTATLSYDQSNRMTEYNAGVNSQEFYLYDASGNRVLKRTISGGSTKLTAYAFGLQELTYTSSGASSGQTDYYAIAGHLIGSTNGSATTYDLTDAEGSVLTSLSSSAVLGEQIYGPYGNQRYTQGTMGTDKGYTGQFQDAATGLDYYNARYYDPVMGQFLSADHVQGNAQGMDPYAYVNGNPETATDPTGQRISCPPDCGGSAPDGSGTPCTLGDSGCNSPVLAKCDTGFHLDGNGGCQQNSNYKPVIPKKPTKSTADPCANDGKCKSDRDHIKDHIRAEQTHESDFWTAIGDAISLGADVLAALLEFGLGQYLAFGLEIASIVSRIAILGGDLAKLGVFSLPTAVIDILQAFKVASTIIDAAGALVSWLNPGKLIGNSIKVLGMTLGKGLVKFIISGAVGASIVGTLGVPKVRDASYWSNQITAVDSYNPQQAYSTCVQDNPTQPAGYC